MEKFHPSTTAAPEGVQLAVSHLGYLPSSPKTLTLTTANPAALPEEIPFYVRQNCFRMPRAADIPEGFSARWPSPYFPLRGTLIAREGSYFYRGVLHRRETRWGTLWQADFSDWRTGGCFQIETDWQVSVPFSVMPRQYERLLMGYLRFLQVQRCGCEVFGVHPACHMDDGILDTDGSPWPVTGGWHDAGDFRKWISFAAGHFHALAALVEERIGDLEHAGMGRAAILKEIEWGNRFFHSMITGEGQVYEDVGGGQAPAGLNFTYERDWWFENHPGCYGDAADNRWTDNKANSGDERRVRTTYNPYVQFAFAAAQARVASLLDAAQGRTCLDLAGRAWKYGRKRGHDGRTVFIAAELMAAIELRAGGFPAVSDVAGLAEQLLSRQDVPSNAVSASLHGYFLEAGAKDAYRSIGFSADPALALLRLLECPSCLSDVHASLRARCSDAITRFIDGYLLADARSNPFGVTPYGIYIDPPHTDRQTFRDAGRGRWVRTFMAPFNAYGLAHGLNGVWMSHAHLLARAGKRLSRPDWSAAAERLLQWTHGHNPVNRSTSAAVGFRQPIGYSFRIPQLPESIMNGFIGWPDDTPYLEESTAIEWNTLEYWCVPYLHAAQAACYL